MRYANDDEAAVCYTIDVMNVFYVFYSGHFLLFLTFFLIFSTFFYLKKRCQIQSINM